MDRINSIDSDFRTVGVVYNNPWIVTGVYHIQDTFQGFLIQLPKFH